MVDLKGQYKKINNEIDEAISKVVKSTNFINGPYVEEFSKSLTDYLKVDFVIPCANGTDALQISLMALDLKKGDEVMCPNFTFISTAEVIKLLNLKIVLVDIDKDTFNLDVNCARKLISEKTRAIIPVHLFGQCANMDDVLSFAKDNNLYVIEDSAQSLGASYTLKNGKTLFSGTIGDIGTTSFYPSKNLGAYGDGGAIMTNNSDLARKIKCISNHGSISSYNYEYLGVNSRLDALQAAILNVKLKYLDNYNLHRLNIANCYDKLLVSCDEISIPVRFKQSTHIFNQYTIKVKNKLHRDSLINFLKSKGISTKIYYPKPIHSYFPYRIKSLKFMENTIDICQKVLSLPIHSEMDLKTVNYISDKIKSFFNKN